MKDTDVFARVVHDEETLETLLENGTVRDPALFWSGRMALTVHAMAVCHVSDISDHFQILEAYTKMYDRVIQERT